MTEKFTFNPEIETPIESDRNRMLAESRKEENELLNSIELNVAKKKLSNFMSNNDEDDRRIPIELEWYHFDTVNWWPNIKPHPGMVVDEVKSLKSNYEEIINSYLKSNPAKIRELQIKLNDWINYWDEISDPKSPSGISTIKPINLEVLMRLLAWTGMELTDNWAESKRRYTIREDWMLGPQTFAAICCFKKEFRKTTTRNSRPY